MIDLFVCLLLTLSPQQASLKDCHYLVDLETSRVSEQEPRFSEMSAEWEVIFRIDFLDSLE